MPGGCCWSSRDSQSVVYFIPYTWWWCLQHPFNRIAGGDSLLINELQLSKSIHETYKEEYCFVDLVLLLSGEHDDDDDKSPKDKTEGRMN